MAGGTAPVARPDESDLVRLFGWKADASGGVPPVLRISLQVVLTVGVTWLIVSRVGVTMEEALAVGAAIPDPRLAWLLASILLLLTCFVATAGLWGRMVGELGGDDPGLLASTRIVLTANLGRYLPGKLWQLAGLAVLSRRVGVSGSLGTAAGVLGQGFHLAGAAVVGVAALVGIGELGWGGRLGLGALAVGVLLASIPPLVQAAMGMAFRWAGLDDPTPPRPDLLFGPRWICLHALVWVGYGTAFMLLVGGLGFETARGFSLAAAFAAAYLLGYLAIFAPAGIGVREGVLIVLLRPSLAGAAVGVSVLARVWMTVVELIPAGAVAVWEIFRRRTDEASERGGKGNG